MEVHSLFTNSGRPSLMHVILDFPGVWTQADPHLIQNAIKDERSRLRSLLLAHYGDHRAFSMGSEKETVTMSPTQQDTILFGFLSI